MLYRLRCNHRCGKIVVDKLDLFYRIELSFEELLKIEELGLDINLTYCILMLIEDFCKILGVYWALDEGRNSIKFK